MIKKYDLFISHASEDKDNFVRELADRLSSLGYRVWYDEFTLTVGDGLRRSIDHGITNSRFGIVVLSKSFFDKGWPNYELDGLVQIELETPGIILPIWHKLSQREVSTYSASLANIVAITTRDRTVSEIITQLERKIGEYHYAVSPDQIISRSSKKMNVSAGRRKAGFQAIMSIQSDHMLNRVDSNSRSELTIYPFSSDFCEYPFHFWQNEPGDIRLVRHVVYEVENESIISSKNVIVQNDGNHLISIVEFSRKSSGPIKIVCDVTTTNFFKGLFEDGFEFVEFNIKSQIEHFSYIFTMHNCPDFREIKVFVNDLTIIPIPVPGALSATHTVRPIIAGSKLRYSFVNEAIMLKS